MLTLEKIYSGSATYPFLRPVYDINISFPNRRCGDPSYIATRLRFGDAETEPGLARIYIGEETSFLRWGAVIDHGWAADAIPAREAPYPKSHIIQLRFLKGMKSQSRKQGVTNTPRYPILAISSIRIKS
jgi:hypothetical protein